VYYLISELLQNRIRLRRRLHYDEFGDVKGTKDYEVDNLDDDDKLTIDQDLALLFHHCIYKFHNWTLAIVPNFIRIFD